ncbi:hypothetical protein FQR65_LT16681 [Abscondita terminalis]|nr:hypothetical protein FQR65_LT16681 [Abscondita terminalis]
MNAYRHELPRGMVQCPVDPFHIMLRHRLTAHMWKCHAQEAEAAKEADYQRKMKEWEQWEKEISAPIQPVVSCSGELPQPFENWDEDPPCPTYVPQPKEGIIKNKNELYYKK